MTESASPAAATGVPKGLPELYLSQHTHGNRAGQTVVAELATARIVGVLVGPVAPVGAPAGWHPFSEKPTKPGRYIVAHRGGIGGHAYYDDPNKPGWSQMPNWNPTHWREAPGRQGCELATDATKQQMFNGLTQEETAATASVMGLVHLAATPIDQDFRRRPASSEAAPTQQDSDSVHEAMSTSSVPTAAPLLSSRETDRSELPRAAEWTPPEGALTVFLYRNPGSGWWVACGHAGTGIYCAHPTAPRLCMQDVVNAWTFLAAHAPVQVPPFPGAAQGDESAASMKAKP